MKPERKVDFGAIDMKTDINQIVATILDSSPEVLAYLLAIGSLVFAGFALYVVLAAIKKKK